MKLITDEFEMLFKDYPLHSQEQVKDPLVIVNFFFHVEERSLIRYLSDQS